MAFDWRAEIARLALWKQKTAEYDDARALPWHLPAVGARAPEIAAAEAEIGRPLGLDFKEFLRFVNGWRGFYLLTDLFGTADFVNRRHVEVIQRPEVRDFLYKNELSGDTLVVGASSLDLDVFLLLSDSDCALPGGVIWYASEEVDRFPSFHSFFSAMVNYNARVFEKLSGKR